MIVSIRRCDNPGCRGEIPEGSKSFELRGLVVVRNGVGRDVYKRAECCSGGCLRETFNALLREATGS